MVSKLPLPVPLPKSSYGSRDMDVVQLCAVLLEQLLQLTGVGCMLDAAGELLRARHLQISHEGDKKAVTVEFCTQCGMQLTEHGTSTSCRFLWP